MNLKKLARNSVCGMFVVVLVACGGGGGGDSSLPSGGSSAPSGGSSAPKNPPQISAQPQSQSALTGATVAFSVSADGSDLTYQWYKNGSAIVGATAATYTIPAVTYLDSGANYTVVVSSAGGSVTSNAAALSLSLSPDQQAFETLNVAPGSGSVMLDWNLNFSGPQASGTNYAHSSLANPIVSPLTNGPQVNVQGALQNMTSGLALLTPAPVRVLKNGVILVVPAIHSNRVTYVGSSVQVDSLATDNVTPAFTQTRSNFSFVPLTGALSTTPDELAHWLNSFFSNPAVLNKAVVYSANAGYLKFDAVNKGDRYNVFDCAGSTTDANVTPCATATSLDTALTAGLVSNSDGKTYHLADGVTSTVAGIPVWVANTARPLSATLGSTTVQYRIYFQLGGNVYTGALIKDGALLGGSYWVSNPAGATVQDRLTLLPYHIRLNKAARDSIASAMAI
jgi:hypothetical protein